MTTVPQIINWEQFILVARHMKESDVEALTKAITNVNLAVLNIVQQSASNTQNQKDEGKNLSCQELQLKENNYRGSEKDSENAGAATSPSLVESCKLKKASNSVDFQEQLKRVLENRARHTTPTYEEVKLRRAPRMTDGRNTVENLVSRGKSKSCKEILEQVVEANQSTRGQLEHGYKWIEAVKGLAKMAGLKKEVVVSFAVIIILLLLLIGIWKN